jgi:hypothetical protein
MELTSVLAPHSAHALRVATRKMTELLDKYIISAYTVDSTAGTSS